MSAAKDTADRLVVDGLRAHEAGQLDEAAEHYQAAIATWPDHSDAFNLAGVVAFQQRDVTRAIGLIGRSLTLNPEHLDAQLNLAEALEANGQLDQALEAARRGRLLAPDASEPHIRISRLLLATGKVALAGAHADVALALDPDGADARSVHAATREKGAVSLTRTRIHTLHFGL